MLSVVTAPSNIMGLGAHGIVTCMTIAVFAKKKNHPRSKTATQKCSLYQYIYQYLPSFCGRMPMPKKSLTLQSEVLFIHTDTVLDRKNNTIPVSTKHLS